MAKKQHKEQQGNARNFFLPFAKTKAEGEKVWQSIRKFAESTTGWEIDDSVRIFAIAFVHNGEDYYAEVGKPEPQTGEPVIAILKSNCYLVCTPNRGVLKGEPLLTGNVFGVIPFADFKGRR